MTPNTRSAGLHAALARLQQTLADRQPGVVEQAMPAEAPHERVERCERHGAWRPYKLDAQGVLRALPGCPSCSRESGLRVMDTESQTPAIFADATFETYACSSRRQEVVVMEIKRHAQRLADAESAGSLVLWGESGTGKTHLAIALLRKCQLAGLSGHYVRAISLMDRLRAARSFNARPEEAQLVDRLAAVDVLVVDDVGKSLGNDFERSSFFNVIDMRWGARKPTIVTTNEPPEVLRDLLTPAGFDRLTEAGAGVLHLDWPSHRRMRLASSAS
ncbi:MULTISPECIES: ATP-binding protein [Ralstonia]|jgi:DNA replication protein DnaC|uniref:AAA+ ATPase domain-containing protein n=3 Tax=Pseudomonadota TaxID=1224 RepID=A0AAD2BTG3_9RALS|nr:MULTISPECIES: ATP-binding protein [Ralstonia]NOZ17940.1 ATP-binding protein [Betaproteobacteria bacterium]AJW47573.1 hypothetical protein TK49_22830 [Ralstonia mannitolilytica]MBA9871396.1 ATP-binding protein [Ralstonia insidiosa]MBA9915650.1 ATP-binding protein [Ralstonia insidiosa]MBA9954641.1 ATP-binding protein [Ralstonia insidiosa]